MQASSAALRVSVPLSVFSAATYVGDAARSILRQTFSDFELIVVDDGSSDASPQILQAFASEDPRVFLTSRANRGLVDTLNEMIAAARGDYLARIDADDIALSKRFARQVEFLDAPHPDVVAARSRATSLTPKAFR